MFGIGNMGPTSDSPFFFLETDQNSRSILLRNAYRDDCLESKSETGHIGQFGKTNDIST